ncbi:MAG: type II/IV secretion system protein [Deferribacteres bacterium]|nr:type II/IV secretion system protein [candidate division KSB1 bacterium]MCB9501297.1 type II/IV secretion system protein [Deferribacteres bacterium]
MDAQKSSKEIIQRLIETEGVKTVDLSEIGLIDQAIIDLIPDDIALKHKVVSFAQDEKQVYLATPNPFDIYTHDAVSELMHEQPVFYYSPESQIDAYLRRYYVQDDMLFDDVEDNSDGQNSDIDDHAIETLKSQGEEGPAIRYVNNILLNAIQERASDIHIEPHENKLKILYRVDGVLHNASTFPKKMHPSIVSRIKILSSLDIAERRLPQDGRTRMKIFGRDIDLRVSTLPTINGEKIVLRILDKDLHSLNIADIGLEPELQEKFKKCLKEPHGMILVTGPTGSGKTTTLYSALNYVNTDKKNIVTVEDPVEYQLPGINQVEAKPDIGLTFSAGLRSTLRQDPDIIMVGEIRDLETAEIAMRSSLTGHLVFSTLHTNSSTASIMRLIDMGIENYLLSSSLLMVVAQRLVRRICLHCSEEYVPELSQSKALQKEAHIIEGVKLYKGKGCQHCGNTGYWGRVALFELLTFENELRDLVLSGESQDSLRHKAEELGMETLLRNGLKKVRSGMTTVEEVMRVTSEVF